MRKVIITKELIANYPHKSSKHRPRRPYCRLCANFDRMRRRSIGYSINFDVCNFHIDVLEIGEKAIEIHFRNGTVAYYSVDCWENPLNARKVESILRQDYRKSD